MEIAKKLLEMGMSIDNIMKATGLSQEEIDNHKDFTWLNDTFSQC